MAGIGFQRFISKITPGFVKSAILNIPYGWSSVLESMRFANNRAGETITVHNAETITAFYTCLRIKAETMASISTTVQKFDGDKQLRAATHPVDSLLSLQSGPFLNAYDFWYTIQIHEDTWGNAYALIHKDQRGVPVRLEILPPWEVDVRMDSEDNSIWYKYKGRAYPARRVLHFKQNSLNGYIGRSIIGINTETLGLAKKQEHYASTVYGEKPPAVFEDGGNVTPETAKKLAETFKDHVKNGLTPMVWGGLKYKPILMPPGDAQFIESRQFTKSDIYGMFRIPPYKLQNYSREAGATYNNVEEQSISFVQDVVVPSIKQKEIECSIKLISAANRGKFRIEFDLSELLKSDMKTQQAYIESLLTRGVINRNEARKMIKMNPIDESIDKNGNRYFIQAGFVPADRADDFIDVGKGSAEGAKHGLNGRASKEEESRLQESGAFEE